MKKRTLTDFYETDVPAYGSYDVLRKISGIDGLKISQRKLVWAGFKRCANDWLKTDTMCAQTQIDTNYIHGAANLESVIDGMVANYVGANNYPLFVGNSGGFGCRISPRPSAGRYTRVKLSPIAKALYSQVDNEILEKQYFEGSYIEPKHLLPIFPGIFLNGSSGMSIGFSHDIYPRNPANVIEYIRKKLSGTEHPRTQLLPWFRGHQGDVAWNEELQRNESFGVVVKNNMNSYTITELPIGVEYQKYKEYLDKLCDNGTIADYVDKCGKTKTDEILFEVKTTREFTRKHESARSLLEVLHLVKSLPETLCCIDENNRVKEYGSIQEILDDFIALRLRYYNKRKEYLLKTLGDDLDKLSSKYVFVKSIVDKKLVVSNRKKDDVVKQLETMAGIIKVNGNYDYLLSMSISHLTKEELEKLKNQIETAKAEYKRVKGTSINDMWLADLTEFKKVLD